MTSVQSVLIVLGVQGDQYRLYWEYRVATVYQQGVQGVQVVLGVQGNHCTECTVVLVEYSVTSVLGVQVYWISRIKRKII